MYGDWATDCYMKEIWSRLAHFGLQMQLGAMKLAPLREGDRWFMEAVEEVGCFSPAEQKLINEMRNHQHVVFESDIFAADGVHLDQQYLSKRQEGDKWSLLKFGKQRPSRKHFILYCKALGKLAPGGHRPCCLGKLTSHGHKVWGWCYCQEEDVLIQEKDNKLEDFRPDQGGPRRGRHK
jgi:hypothetical protein